jgi:type II secretion system protein H
MKMAASSSRSDRARMRPTPGARVCDPQRVAGGSNSGNSSYIASPADVLRLIEPRAAKVRRAFTLIEVMVVVAIMGLIMAMGVPSILAAVKKDGMRKAISDLTDACNTARAQAIMQNQKVALEFHPGEKTFGSYALPSGVDFAMLDINMQDYGGSEDCRVFFNPDGTSDEMTIVLHAKDQWRKITLEFSTGIPMVSDVDK